MVKTPNYDLDIDSTLGGSNASDYIIPSQKAIKEYVDNNSGGNPSFANITGQPTDNTNLANALNAKQDAATAVNYNNISNCITEIPQDIKLELNNGTLTLKSGSKVYVPNGSGVFDEITIQSDVSATNTASGGASFVYYLPSANNLVFSFISGTGSGTTTPSSGVYYNTSINQIGAASSGSLTDKRSFPIAIVQRTGSISSIDQVFNGFGYIGSTIFALPEVKGLIPNGRNDDGTLKNIEVTQNIVFTRNLTSSGVWNLVFTDTNVLQVATGYTYNENENLVYWTDGKVYPRIICGEAITSSGGVITSLTPKTPFHAVDYNDFSELKDTVDTKANDSAVVKLTGNQTVAGQKTFTDDIFTENIIPQGRITLGTSTNTWGYMIRFQDTTGKRIARVQPMAIDTTKNKIGMWVNNADNTVEQGIEIWSDGTTVAPTPATSDNSTQIATTANVDAKIAAQAVKLTGNQTVAGTKTFSSSPVLPTPATSDNSTKGATTAYVNNKFQVVSALPATPDSDTFYFITA